MSNLPSMELVRGAVILNQKEATASALNRLALMKAGLEPLEARKVDLEGLKQFASPVQEVADDITEVKDSSPEI